MSKFPDNVLEYNRVTEIIGDVIAPHPRLIDWVRIWERQGKDTKAYTDIKANQGTFVHAWVQSILENVPSAPAGQYEHWKPVVDDVVAYVRDRKLLHVEVPLWDDSLKCRGTADYVYKDKDGLLVVGDLKTGRPSRTHKIQINAYAYMYQKMFNQKVDYGELIYTGEKGLGIDKVTIHDIWPSVIHLRNSL